MTKDPTVDGERGRPPLKITSEAEFGALMDEIDRELIAEDIAIPARPIAAGLRITKKFDVVLNAAPGDRPILPNSFTPDQISLRVHEWMKRRYGDRLNLDWTVGRTVLPLRGSLYSIRCPTVYGTVRFVCEPRTFGQPRKTLGVNSTPTSNMVDLIDGFTADLALSLTPAEVIQIGAVFTSAMDSYVAVLAVRDVQFVEQAWGDHAAAVGHLMEHSPQLGLAKWASLQAAEKLLKAYIVTKGSTVKKHHNIKEHAEDAAKLGLPLPPARYLKDIQCFAGVRYGEESVSVTDAVTAHLISLEMCKVAAQSIGRAMNRNMPKSSEPLVDGIPMRQFLQQHAK